MPLYTEIHKLPQLEGRDLEVTLRYNPESNPILYRVSITEPWHTLRRTVYFNIHEYNRSYPTREVVMKAVNQFLEVKDES